MELVKIGIIHSPYKTKEQAPRQGADSEEVCYIEIFEKYIEGLKDIEEARYLIVLYWGHQSSREVLTTLTPFSDVPKGVFACRSPNRPNPILLDIAELIDIKGNVLVVKGIDAIDGSPVIDIKPYYERIDIPKGLKEGIFKVQSN
ncbi:tRNA (N6-threonylcarbamoyladenosine(37)-N6)-methyltransferase TrmO [Anaerocellum danielii]|uniref:tRNA (N6-threonylcarbamoyladenosine(37)-N6)-methyltransferase TrmO n=1 Tax=Anaerocellum danielii TaxID=1387557 RepID=A0ABZ0U0A6_9FIRM|nr:tRNA (N6-threonylcarbamoyladenosine(37)-N6)-methyltransferase TrmO [Caldicellulosiruptor danielii]WPX09100.1 tRNA (N6-threonylcarbamoyladenosine(37)-N6)-methyltransferase TrmO [Caldicellulosiruptor danielii]